MTIQELNPFRSGGKLHFIKNLYLRYRYGAGCCDVFNADYYLAKKILPVLKQFKKRNYGYPMNLTSEEWDKILEEMIWSFQYLVDGEKDESPKNWKRAERGYKLFGKWYRNLWF